MSWNSRVNPKYGGEHPSTPIYSLRKAGKLEEAFQLAQKLLKHIPNSNDIKKAFSWVLIDLCKKYISEQNLSKAQEHFNQLASIKFDFQDQFVETIKKQIYILKPKVESNYLEIQIAEDLSKNGKNKEAIAIFKELISQNRLSEIHHESYGWVIYRYIKTEESNLSSLELRTFLRDYLSLKNDRPSLLHSKVLNFALNYSKTNSDFKFYNFLLLWNPGDFRSEDLFDSFNEDGKAIPPLILRIIKELVNSAKDFDVEEFLNKTKLDKETIVDFLREAFFWKIFNAYKENKISDLWLLFEIYNYNYSKYGQSKWHSEILNLAERYMVENDNWRFLSFLKNWNPVNLRTDDWKETIKDQHKYKPLAIKVIRKAFDVLKSQQSEHDLTWLIQLYETAITLFPNDEWLLREKALLHFRNNEFDLAIKIYKQLVLVLSDKNYVWQEFSNCIISDSSLKIGMLSKALSLEKNEDFLGDIHLDIAKVLIDENLLENALVELEEFKKHRELKGWKLSSFFYELYQKVSLVTHSLKDNKELYKTYIPFAENFAYADFDWTELVLVDKWKDEKGKDRLTFTDGKTIEFPISKNRFEVFNQLELGQILKFKLHKQEIKREVEAQLEWFISRRRIVKEYKYIPLVAIKSEKKNWEILEDVFAIIDYINKEKNIIHAITSQNKEVFFPQIKPELQIGDFISAKSYVKKVKDANRTELQQIQKIDKGSVISKFETQIAIVDGINEQKQLFHFVISPNLQGIIKFTETSIRPSEGDFIKLSFATKTDKDKKIRVKTLNVELTDEKNENLRKKISGLLEVRFRSGSNSTYGFEDEIVDEVYDEISILNNHSIPDYGFVGGCYVSKHLLVKHNITFNIMVNAIAVFTGEKWKILQLEKI